MDTINFNITIDNITYASYYNNDTSSIEASLVASDINITTANIPQSIIYDNVSYNVTKLEACCFQNCINLTNIIIEGPIYSIGDLAFQNCNNLQSFTITNQSNNINLGACVFQNTNNLNNLLVNGSFNTINNMTFQNSNKLIISSDLVYSVFPTNTFTLPQFKNISI